jgi:hypothetical protein
MAQRMIHVLPMQFRAGPLQDGGKVKGYRVWALALD